MTPGGPTSARFGPTASPLQVLARADPDRWPRLAFASLRRPRRPRTHIGFSHSHILASHDEMRMYPGACRRTHVRLVCTAHTCPCAGWTDQQRCEPCRDDDPQLQRHAGVRPLHGLGEAGGMCLRPGRPPPLCAGLDLAGNTPPTRHGTPAGATRSNATVIAARASTHLHSSAAVGMLALRQLAPTVAC